MKRRNPTSGLISEDKIALATDLYQLTMSKGYFDKNKTEEIATFDLFVRSLPKERSYLLVAGLEQALWYLTEGMHFDEDSVEFLRQKFDLDHGDPFLDYLTNFKFTGDAQAMPEGTVAFGMEPLLTITAPIIEAQLAETYLLTTYNHQTKIASKAARCVEAAQGRPVIEFGMRRTDVGAATRGARAAYIGGSIGTSNVIAEYMFDVPSFGTHAHSWIMSFPSEEESFKAYFEVFGEKTVALIDTYDTLEGAKKAAALPGKIKGVRLDSGDMTALSKDVRNILDASGKTDGIIFASSDLNEYKITQMLSDGAKIDAFGVGTELTLSKDAPALGGVYKLAQIQISDKIYPKLKLSEDKATLPGVKQVYREVREGLYVRDTIGLRDEAIEGLEELLVPVIENGKLVYEIPELHNVREYAKENIGKLHQMYKGLEGDHSYSIDITKKLSDLTDKLVSQYSSNSLRGDTK
jgi:nicotinate phosphoribosyltransferase